MGKICIGYNDITKEYIYMDNNTGITSISKEWLNVPYEPDNNVERFVLDMSIADLKKELEITEKALELAVSQLDDAKDMLRECGKRDWAGMLDTSVDYFKARAKESMKSE